MKYIRLLLCMLAVCFAFLLFTACSQKNIPQENVSQNEGFGGEIFYFLGSFIPSDARDADLITDEISSETVSVEGIEEEVMFAQCKKVVENYNCRIVCQPGFGPYSTNAQFAAAYAAGIQQGDFISTDNNTLLDLYQSGLLVDLDSIEALNLEDTEKWGVYSLRTATTSRGVLYAIPMQGSRYMPIFKSYNGAFFYNSELYDTFDMDMTPKEMVEQGKISASHARTIAVAQDPSALAHQIIEKNISVADTEKMVRGTARRSTSRAYASKTIDADTVRDIESKISAALKVPVKLQERRGGAGQIVLSFSTRTQMQELVDKLVADKQ